MNDTMKDILIKMLDKYGYEYVREEVEFTSHAVPRGMLGPSLCFMCNGNCANYINVHSIKTQRIFGSWRLETFWPDKPFVHYCHDCYLKISLVSV